MATQEQRSSEITYGDRFKRDKFFELYQRAVELGTWDVEKVIAKAPIEEDRETWAEMGPNEKTRWSLYVSGFLDGEHEVAQDASKLVQMMGSPYLDNQAPKEAFFTTLQFEETKHTQFVSWYADNVVPDDVMPKTGVGVRNGLTRLILDDPDEKDYGLNALFDDQRDALNTAIYTREPQDIARAITVYNLHVEGLFARSAFNGMKAMHDANPLPTWIKTFELISTDEGRHITAGIELVKELVEKEKDGDVDFTGVSRTVWGQVQEDVWKLSMSAVREAYAIALLTGREGDEEFIDQQIEQQVEQYVRYTNDMYRRRIDLPHYDEEILRNNLNKDIEHTKEELDASYLEEMMDMRGELQEVLALEDEKVGAD